MTHEQAIRKINKFLKGWAHQDPEARDADLWTGIKYICDNIKKPDICKKCVYLDAYNKLNTGKSMKINRNFHTYKG